MALWGRGGVFCDGSPGEAISECVVSSVAKTPASKRPWKETEAWQQEGGEATGEGVASEAVVTQGLERRQDLGMIMKGSGSFCSCAVSLSPSFAHSLLRKMKACRGPVHCSL